MSDITPGVNDPQSSVPAHDWAVADPSTPSGAQAPGSSDASTKDVAADEAKSVAADAQASGRQVAETAKEQAADVVDEVRTQARDVYAQAKEELAGHAAEQHRRAGAGLHALADELHGMVDGSQGGGLATDLAHEAAGRVSALAGWFDGHEPGDALEELRSIARRRPGAFLAGAAVLGLVAGRLTRGGVDEARDDTDSQDASTDRTVPAYGTAPVPVSSTGRLSDENGTGLMAPEPGYGDVVVVDADPYSTASSHQADRS